MVSEKFYQSASDVRKNWSMTIDSVVHNKPAFINRTHDNIAMLNSGLLTDMLKSYKFNVILDEEEDGSITGFVEELRLVENAQSREELLDEIVKAMKEYAVDYYAEFDLWSKSPNLVSQVPYVIKLLLSDEREVLEDIICQNGKN